MVRPLDGRAVSGAARALTRHTTWIVAACAAAAVTAAVVPPVLGPQSGQLASGSVVGSTTSGSTLSAGAASSRTPSASPSATVSDPIVTAGGGAAAPGAAQHATFTGAGDIPGAALQAYQRAAVVINAAIPTCKIQWQLLAAVGRVESNHGQAEGNTLDADGVDQPGVFGPVLNGRAATTRVVDTDGGRFDGNTKLDRAVGPMQFLPATWAVVGVDADGDGQRNPQDIDDASLAAAVYLCGGHTDLSTRSGQRAAIYRYNHSDSYVTTVMSVMKAYLGGDFSSDPVIAPLPVTVPETPFTPGQTPFVRSVRHEAQSIVRHPLLGFETVAPGSTGSPATPDQPTHPTTPATPTRPSTPTTPSTPSTPASGSPSGTPSSPSTPADPSSSSTPSAPTTSADPSDSAPDSAATSDSASDSATDSATGSTADSSDDITEPTATAGDPIIDQCDLNGDDKVDETGVPASCGTPDDPSPLATVTTDDNTPGTPAPTPDPSQPATEPASASAS